MRGFQKKLAIIIHPTKFTFNNLLFNNKNKQQNHTRIKKATKFTTKAYLKGKITFYKKICQKSANFAKVFKKILSPAA